MALTSASQGASGTPATALYTTLAGLLTTASWTLIETATAAQAGTTDIVKVWRNAAGKVHVLIEVDDTNSRLRFRVSEEYAKVQTITLTTPAAGNSFKQTYGGSESIAFVIGTNCTAAAIQTELRTLTGNSTLTVTGTTDTGPFTVTFANAFNNTLLTATSVTGGTLVVVDTNDHKMLYPCPGYASGTSNTPSGTNAVSETTQTIFQTQGVSSTVGWLNIPVSGGGFAYVMGANASEVVLATSATQSNWVHAGYMVAGDNLSPASTLCFVGGRATVSLTTNASWTMTAATDGGNYRVTREPNQGAVALAGVFCYTSATVAATEGVEGGAGGQPGTAHKWLTAMAAYVSYLHNAATVASAAAIRTHLSKLSSMAVVGQDTVGITAGLTTVGDTVTLDGSTYYTLGPTTLVMSAGGLWQCRTMCAKSSAF